MMIITEEEQRQRFEADIQRSWGDLADEARSLAKTIRATRGITRGRNVTRLAAVATAMCLKVEREMRAELDEKRASPR